MSLNRRHEIVIWPVTHYVYIEKVGPFQETAPKAWQEVHGYASDLAKNNKIISGLSLYKVEPKIYRAGFSLAEEPKNLPEGLTYTLFEGGTYVRFVLTGSYSQLPEACGIVFEIIEAEGIQISNRFCLEHYVTDPSSTPEDQLITEILIPT